MSRRIRWTEQDDVRLQELFKEKSVDEIAIEMNRHRFTILNKLKRLGLREPRSAKWSLDELEYLKQNYPTKGAKHCAQYLGRTSRSVECEAAKNGIRVTYTYRMVDKDGYIEVVLASSVKIKEHRLIMEKFLKRKLEANEHVHHLDEDKTNNTLMNLIVITPANHNTLHAAIKRKDIEVLRKIAEALSNYDRPKYEAWLEKFSRDIV